MAWPMAQLLAAAGWPPKSTAAVAALLLGLLAVLVGFGFGVLLAVGLVLVVLLTALGALASFSVVVPWARYFGLFCSAFTRLTSIERSLTSTISTRRFLPRCSASLLSATGREAPAPWKYMRSALIPCSARMLATARARRSESFWLVCALPLASVWPTTKMAVFCSPAK